jgi:hypothetical protein
VNVLPTLGNLSGDWKRAGSVRLRDEDGIQFHVKPLPQPQDLEHRIVYGGEVAPKGTRCGFFQGATSTNSCSSEQLKHNVPTRFITCSHEEIAVSICTLSDATRVLAPFVQFCGNR